MIFLDIFGYFSHVVLIQLYLNITMSDSISFELVFSLGVVVLFHSRICCFSPGLIRYAFYSVVGLQEGVTCASSFFVFFFLPLMHSLCLS